MDDYARHLFAYVPAERLKTWSCGHIIPKDNLFVRSISQSSNGTDLDFSFTKRESVPMVHALGSCILDMAATIPDGLVLFFPSYAYLDHVANQWQKAAPNSTNVWNRLERLKPLFMESKCSSSVENTLLQYSKAIDKGRGGILLSVVGGKLSEGINFSDKLGRGVAIVGLPFPNNQSAQWKAKMEYIERSTLDHGGTSAEGKAAGREFYENACMRAVNQSIGRAIRHQKDYASILLLDRRYSMLRISDKLPGWIKQGLPQAMRSLPFQILLDNYTVSSNPSTSVRVGKWQSMIGKHTFREAWYDAGAHPILESYCAITWCVISVYPPCLGWLQVGEIVYLVTMGISLEIQL